MKKDQSWVLPSLKDAQKRTKNTSEIKHNEFTLTEEEKTLGNGYTYHVRTYGCQANERDSETMAGILEAMGFTAQEDILKADVVILNTCAIRQNAEDRVIGEIGNLKHQKKKNPNFILAVCGCMAQEEEVVDEILQKHRQVDIIFGTHNIHHLPVLLHQCMQQNKRIVEVLSKEGEVIENLPVSRFGAHKAWVNIMYGCDKFCTYCIVPYTRGKERSRTMEDVLKEVQILKEQGYKEVTLLGQNVNAYGKDLGLEGGFATLLKAVAQIGIPRIRFSTSHPWDFSDAMIETIAEYPNIMPAIHLPVQSGNSEILKLMGRRYTIEEYKTLYDKIKKAIPECTVTTDIIVGFPNETEEQFLQTLEIAEYCKYDNAFTFVYSPRKGTPAARMVDNVPAEEKDQRLARLNEVIHKYARINNEKFENAILEVLCDGPSKRNSEIMSGYSKENKLVNFKALPNTKEGDIVKVKITCVKSFSLDGEEIA
ncbi:MAG: tRNA (N6-isopentenyl adenosine(37)-C2)-methylthiotransferase MiaB [Erysipelotrichales bacterium]|nr:tRNA (N6-isopentenyl adenosine(37)-C2)-methylthiotransferase MiaB [Erysipelotrichales bacterium]